MKIFGWTPRRIQQTFCSHDWRYGDEARQCIKCGRHESEIIVPVGRAYALTDPWDTQPAEKWKQTDQKFYDMFNPTVEPRNVGWSTITPALKDGVYWVRATAYGSGPPVKAKLLQGVWFRTDGKSDGVLWFAPDEYSELT